MPCSESTPIAATVRTPTSLSTPSPSPSPTDRGAGREDLARCCASNRTRRAGLRRTPTEGPCRSPALPSGARSDGPHPDRLRQRPGSQPRTAIVRPPRSAPRSSSVIVLVRSKELPLSPRLGPHPRTLIADATRSGELFEYWVHEAS